MKCKDCRASWALFEIVMNNAGELAQNIKKIKRKMKLRDEDDDYPARSSVFISTLTISFFPY